MGMEMRSGLLAALVFMFASPGVDAASELRQPVVLLPREAKLSPGLSTFVSSTLPGPYIGGWMDKTRFIDFELKVEPGRYRLVARIIPQAGGYLSAKIDEAQAVRRSVSKIREAMYSPMEIKFGEIDIPKSGAHLRFLGDNISPPGLCLFFQAELVWVAPSTVAAKVKSPLLLAAEKEQAVKELDAAKSSQALLESLKGTTWTFFVMSNDFTGQAVPMVFSVDGRLSLFGGANKNYKALDGRTLDIFYGAPGAYSRLRFADDLRSFKADVEEGIRMPRSGRLQEVSGSPTGRTGQPRVGANPAASGVAK